MCAWLSLPRWICLAKWKMCTSVSVFCIIYMYNLFSSFREFTYQPPIIVRLQTYINDKIRWKVAYFLRKIQTLRVNYSRILRIKNAKFSGYCFRTIIRRFSNLCSFTFEAKLRFLCSVNWKKLSTSHLY